MTIPLSALLAPSGFIKGVVVFQVDWSMLPISAAGDVYNNNNNNNMTISTMAP